MSIADWIILGFLAFSVTAAAIEGFFHEAFKLAGLVVGYLLAAWQYHRLAEWFAPHLKSPWIGEIAGFLIIFFCGPDRCRPCWPGRPLGNEESRSKRD